MLDNILRIRIYLVIPAAIALSGCAFIVKDDHAAKYYGIDERRGSEYLNQILEKQRQVHDAAKSSLGAARRLRCLYGLNKDTIKNPSKLKPG